MVIRSLLVGLIALGSVAGLVVLSAGCNLLQNAFTSPSSTSNTTTESFSGSLPVLGSDVSTFTVAQSGTVTVTLTALSASVPVGAWGWNAQWNELSAGQIRRFAHKLLIGLRLPFCIPFVPEWRNWQTRETQNRDSASPVRFEILRKSLSQKEIHRSPSEA